MKMTQEHLDARVIVCSAILDSETGRLWCGPRHHNCFWAISECREDGEDLDGENMIQGFVDQFFNFLTRTEAWPIAERNKQIVTRCGGDGTNGGTLYSENLY